jgi:hypothetical protein
VIEPFAAVHHSEHGGYGSVIPVAAPLIDGTAMWLTVQFSRVAGGAPRDSRAGLSKLNSMQG